MGNHSSRNIEFEEALGRFSEPEKTAIEKCFTSISSDISDTQRAVDFGLFKKHVEWLFSEEIAQRYFKEMCEVEKTLPTDNPREGEVSREAFYIALAHSLHGNHHQIAHILLLLASVGNNPSVKDMNKLINTFMNAYAKSFKKSEYESKWRIENNEESAQKVADLLCEDLESKDGSISAEDVEKWLSKQPLVEHLFETVSKLCFIGLSSVFGTHWHGQHQGCEPSPGKHSHSNRNILMPCKMKAKWEEVHTILDIPQVLLLNHQLPAMCRHRWRLLFSSQVHGESFTRLMHQISHQGPTVLVIKDADGYIFGGFASQEWSVKSHFTGDDKSFLFSLCPTLAVYHPTGYNENYMYLNIGMETLPNGLGMGGQFDYFGLYLNQEYGKGHSKAQPKCTTFGSPQLSEKTDFSIQVLEIWGVGLPPEQEPKKRSVLDTETEAKALLEIAGKEIHSEGLREPDSFSDDEEA